MPATSWSLMKIYGRHVRRHGWGVFALCAVIVAANLIHLAVPFWYKKFFDTVAHPESAQPDLFAALVGILFTVIALRFTTWACWRASGFIASYLQPAIVAELGQSAFQHMLRHSYQFFVNSFAGSLVRKIHRFTGAFANLAEKFLWTLLPLVVTLVGMVIVLYRREPSIAFLVLGWIVIFSTITWTVSMWKLKYDVIRAAKDSEATGALSDTISNSANVKLFSGYDNEVGVYRRIMQEWRKLQTFTWRLAELDISIQAMLSILIELGAMYMGIRLFLEGRFSIGDLVFLQSYVGILIDQIWGFGRVIRGVYENVADAKEMADIFEMPFDVRDKKNAKPLTVSAGKIEFRDVSFVYSKTRQVLRDYSLAIKPKEKIALIGPSGAGKSTIVKLLFRFYDVGGGKILIDGQDISAVTQDSLRGVIALVPQEPDLFHRSVMENIRYGRRDAADEEVMEAAKRAHCHVFISELPQGYETFVGERGVKLSGGERQRVAIARAILKNAPILVLDEATSSLDSESEALIQDALKELMRDKTVIAIAHRLSTIMQMDRIVVMEEGKVMDMGTHADLTKKAGTYKKLWEIQAGGFLAG